jgi:2-isopropylmalate synthase
MQYKLKMQPSEVLQLIASSVKFAKNNVAQVEWSAEDATRSELDFLFKAIEIAINNGATIINLPDTVGYTTPNQYFELIKAVKNNVVNIDKAIISVHCHDDLGLATANSLAGVLAGAGQIECTINGIGERAGNTALEEVVMAIKTRSDFYQATTNIETTQISRISKLVSSITGFAVPPNKAIVGSNAFAHESGIHQDGMLKNRQTYEIISPETVGVEKTLLKLGKLSGRAAFKDRLKFLGYDISEELLNEAFIQFKDLADKKKEVSDADLISLVDSSITHKNSAYQLLDLLVNCGNNKNAEVFLKIKIDTNIKEVNFISKDGPVDAIFSAINQLILHKATLELYQVQAVTAGTDAQASVLVRLCQNGRIFSANGASTDVLVASALAYLNCLEKLKNF